MLSIVGVSTPMLFREKTCAVNCGCEHTHTVREETCAVHCECEHTYTVQRGNLCCQLWVWAHPYCSEMKPFLLSNVGVSPPILQRGNLSCCPLWVWAHPYSSERKPVLSIVGVRTPILFREKTLCAVNWVWAHPYCSERKPVLPIVGVSTPILFREKTFCAVNCGCEHTHTVREETFCAVHCECEHTHTVQRGNLLCCQQWAWAHPYCSERKPFMLCNVGVSPPILQRGNLSCCPLWVWAHPYCSERKPVLSIVGVSTPILFRKKTCCSVNCGCEHTHTVQGGKLLCCPLWTPTHTFREETLYAMCFHKLSSPCDDLTN